MTDDRKNIKVPAELFERLNEDKPKYDTWAAYLERECLSNE